MLTEKEKDIVRILIEHKPDSAYMRQLSESDDFARNEIEAKKAEITESLERRVEWISNDIAGLQDKLERAQADLAALNESE